MRYRVAQNPPNTGFTDAELEGILHGCQSLEEVRDAFKVFMPDYSHLRISENHVHCITRYGKKIIIKQLE